MCLGGYRLDAIINYNVLVSTTRNNWISVSEIWIGCYIFLCCKFNKSVLCIRFLVMWWFCFKFLFCWKWFGWTDVLFFLFKMKFLGWKIKRWVFGDNFEGDNMENLSCQIIWTGIQLCWRYYWLEWPGHSAFLLFLFRNCSPDLVKIFHMLWGVMQCSDVCCP